ncbi:phosphomannomutase [Prosthecochloris sp. ZM_2]|uniref:phosphomannomutase n=1 Tax=Prosthecochloris sp. ZM_2 TaxID=2045206 RepID=UPI001F437043|nr:phosphomannomutase [Prosthecochloris sp. ZM_2]
MELLETSGVKFGTSGARGLVSDMTDRVCYGFTAVFLECALSRTGGRRAETGRVVLGHDLRPSSPGIARACARAVMDWGAEVVYAGALPTPALALYGLECGAPVVVVTGSHIPFDRNGIKFYREDGEMTKEDEVAMMACEVEVPEVVEPAVLPDVEKRARELYVQRYLDFFGARALAGMRIGVYEHSSVARDVVREVLEGLGAEVVSLGRTETFVPIDTEAVRPEDVKQAREWAREVGFDAIVSTDGDGDRPLIGDERGEWMRGDVVGILCAEFLGASAVVTPVSCNTAVECALSRAGGGGACGAGGEGDERREARDRGTLLRAGGRRPETGDRSGCGVEEGVTSDELRVTRGGGALSCAGDGRAEAGVVRVLRTRIGSPYVIAGMEGVETDGVVVGYEANGGFLLGSDVVRDGKVLRALPTRDAVLPMLVVLCMARERGCRVSEVTDWLPERYTASDRLKEVPTEWSRELIDRLHGDREEMRQLLDPGSGDVVMVDMTDGLRVTFETGDIVHLRPSGNAPELRCYAEAGSVERAQELCEGALGRIGAPGVQ